MKISVKVKTGSRGERLEKKGAHDFAVWVKERPIGGAANKTLVRIFSEYFRVPQLSIKIILGATAKKKIIEIVD